MSDSIVNITLSVSWKKKKEKKNSLPDHNIQHRQYVGGWSMWFQNVPREMLSLGCKYLSRSYNAKKGIIPRYVVRMFFVYFAWLRIVLSIPLLPFEATSPTGNNQITQRMDFIDALNEVIAGTATITGCDIYVAVTSLVATRCICVSHLSPSFSLKCCIWPMAWRACFEVCALCGGYFMVMLLQCNWITEMSTNTSSRVEALSWCYMAHQKNLNGLVRM